MIGQRLEPTLSLALVAIILTILISVPLGVLAAWKHGSWIDNLVMSASVLGFSIPVFVIGYLLATLFAIELRWLPVQGFTSITKGVWPFAERIILPALTLSSVYIALVARMTRASVLEVLGEDYIRTARAKGLSEIHVLFRHALRNSMIPILTVIGTGFALMISGVVVTESVFNIPGLGRLIVDAVLARDYPVIQGMILLTSGVYVIINLLIDLSYALSDPRIRY
nr:ABC transporter permease [Pantoea cypripedii]